MNSLSQMYNKERKEREREKVGREREESTRVREREGTQIERVMEEENSPLSFSMLRGAKRESKRERDSSGRYIRSRKRERTGEFEVSD